MIGSVLDARYELLERVCESSFFTVFKARDRVLNRTVAIKILLPRYAANAEFAARLRSEMAAVTSLSHPGITRVYEVGESDGVIYMATEYVRGGNLKDPIRKSAPFPAARAVEIGIAVAQALDYAHRAGFVHGELIPQNVLVTPEMDVKLTDFGVSRAVTASALFHSNALLRGVHYLAPEVAEGQEATPASDIYAMGVMLFEMLTGTLPYTGETPLAVALKHAQEPVPSPRSLNPNVPRALAGIVMKALAKDPSERYASAAEMMRDLRRADECLRLGRPLTWSPLEEQPASPSDGPAEAGAYAAKSGRDGWRVATVFLLVVVCLLVAGLGVFVFSGIGMPRDVLIPPIVGKSRQDAEAMLKQAGLTMKVVQEEYSDQYAAGQVIHTIPEAGRQVTEGREIRAVVSLGPQMVTVPDVLHATLTEARRVLKEASLAAGTIRRDYSDLVPAEQVMAQDPGPDRQVPKGSKVALTISRGSQPGSGDQEGWQENTQKPSRPSRQRQRWEVTVEVPPGEERQMVRIAVVEDGQEVEKYSQMHPAGDKFTTTVETTTSPATIRVYIDDRLVSEEQVGTPE